MADDQTHVIALVTAYNEAVTVGPVIDALKAATAVSAVQLVDDGSTDGTSALGEAAGATVIRLPERIPVGAAIMHHLTALEGDPLLLWCDADLVGLAPEHADALVARYRRGDVSQVTSSRGVPQSWPGWLRGGPVRFLWAEFFGPLSGERVIRRSEFEAAIGLAQRLGWEEMMRGYGIVLFLNWYCAAFGKGSRVVYFDTLRQRQKYQKWGGNRPVRQMAGQWVQFARVWLRIRLHARRIRAMASGNSDVV